MRKLKTAKARKTKSTNKTEPKPVSRSDQITPSMTTEPEWSPEARALLEKIAARLRGE